MSGPYETVDDVHAEVRDIHAAHHKHGVRQAKTLDLLLRVCDEHEVRLGAYDLEVLRWLAGRDPELSQVVAALIHRAAAGGHG
ncbi:hypothetical protein [Spirillospora sp. CA-294931]|uniref:hypothetical protein n=1 Tax=Spirillospora sp. CA-294931 TaxID=3240042 RepID=UPI003D8E59D8